MPGAGLLTGPEENRLGNIDFDYATAVDFGVPFPGLFYYIDRRLIQRCITRRPLDRKVTGFSVYCYLELDDSRSFIVMLDLEPRVIQSAFHKLLKVFHAAGILGGCQEVFDLFIHRPVFIIAFDPARFSFPVHRLARKLPGRVKSDPGAVAFSFLPAASDADLPIGIPGCVGAGQDKVLKAAILAPLTS